VRLSLKWLSEYVDIALPPEEVAHRLTMAGLEVSNIEQVGGTWDNVYVGQVLDLQRHPNADRLLLATVDYGQGTKTVVTGAPNLEVGQKVPFALVGARLYDGHAAEAALMALKPAKLRGIMSEGMVCSERELGLGGDHSGIMILDPNTRVGAPLAEVLGDSLFDLKFTPNRPDWLSMLGIAWEVGALTGQKVRVPSVTHLRAEPSIKGIIDVEIAGPDLCRRYTASYIEGVKIGPSPDWMQRRLIAAGQRPINNVVDITNYVMLEFGQPLHAFDYNYIGGKKIIVRRSRAGERILTLDGTWRPLESDTLVIADVSEPVAVAGLMGGGPTEVSEATTNVLLESANFSHVSLRQTSRMLRLATEASRRFDKGLDPELTVPALERATDLVVELGGGHAAGHRSTISNESSGSPRKRGASSSRREASVTKQRSVPRPAAGGSRWGSSAARAAPAIAVAESTRVTGRPKAVAAARAITGARSG